MRLSFMTKNHTHFQVKFKYMKPHFSGEIYGVYSQMPRVKKNPIILMPLN